MGLGILLAILAAIGWGAGDVFVRRAMFRARPGAVTVVVAAMVLVMLGGVVTGTAGLGSLAPPNAAFVVLVALMGLLTWLGGNLMYFQGMHRAGVVIAAPLLGMAPVFAILLAVTVGGERPGAATLAGAVAIVAGVVVVLTDRGRVLREQ